MTRPIMRSSSSGTTSRSSWDSSHKLPQTRKSLTLSLPVQLVSLGEILCKLFMWSVNSNYKKYGVYWMLCCSFVIQLHSVLLVLYMNCVFCTGICAAYSTLKCCPWLRSSPSARCCYWVAAPRPTRRALWPRGRPRR